MTTRIMVENVGPDTIGVSPVHPSEPLYGTDRQSVLVKPGTTTEFYVHAGQSIIINEIKD